MIKIGVLALQGAFREHVEILSKINDSNIFEEKLNVKEIKTVKDFKEFKPDGLILPGGESTSMAIIESDGGESLFDTIKKYREDGYPIYGTCAGSIMLCNKVEGQKVGGQALIGGLDATISRNYFGRQINSFETKIELNLPSVEDDGASVNRIEFPGIFIRAPAILNVSDQVQVLGEYQRINKEGNKEKVIVAAKQSNLLVTVFHPELTQDIRFHKYFIDFIKLNQKK
eukprot:gene4229-5295_t